MVGIRDMTSLARTLSWFTIERYAFDAVIKTGELVPIRGRGGDFSDRPIRGTLYKLGLKYTDEAEDMGLSLAELSGILGGTTIVLLVATVAVVAIRTRRANR
jgi:hypothetical protein